MSSPVVLIFGAGSRVGQSVASAFAAKGYKVALNARSLQASDDTPDQVNIAGDLADPNTVPDVFAKVKAKLGIPSVVVYNGELTRDDPTAADSAKPVVEMQTHQMIHYLFP